jgi:hypothetical protein
MTASPKKRTRRDVDLQTPGLRRTALAGLRRTLPPIWARSVPAPDCLFSQENESSRATLTAITTSAGRGSDKPLPPQPRPPFPQLPFEHLEQTDSRCRCQPAVSFSTVQKEQEMKRMGRGGSYPMGFWRGTTPWAPSAPAVDLEIFVRRRPAGAVRERPPGRQCRQKSATEGPASRSYSA